MVRIPQFEPLGKLPLRRNVEHVSAAAASGAQGSAPTPAQEAQVYQ